MIEDRPKEWFEDIIAPYIVKGWRVHFFDDNICEIKMRSATKTFVRRKDGKSIINSENRRPD